MRQVELATPIRVDARGRRGDRAVEVRRGGVVRHSASELLERNHLAVAVAEVGRDRCRCQRLVADLVDHPVPLGGITLVIRQRLGADGLGRQGRTRAAREGDGGNDEHGSSQDHHQALSHAHILSMLRLPPVPVPGLGYGIQCSCNLSILSIPQKYQNISV